MSFLDSIFGSQTKGEGWEEKPLTESQKSAEKYLEDLIAGKVTFEPRKIAEFPPAMQEAIAQVDKIMAGGIPEIDQAIQVTADRMMAPPEQVPGLEGLFSRTREMGADLLGRTKRGLALTGNLPGESSAGEKIYGRTFQDIMNEMVTSAFPFYSQGLEAKYRAPSELANLGIQKATIPLNLATTVGALPMQKEQSEFDAIMEAVRKTQTFPYDAQAGIASGLLNREAYAYNPGTTSPSIFSQVAAPLAMLGSAAIMGPAGPAAMAGAGAAGTTAPWNYTNPYPTSGRTGFGGL